MSVFVSAEHLPCLQSVPEPGGHTGARAACRHLSAPPGRGARAAGPVCIGGQDPPRSLCPLSLQHLGASGFSRETEPAGGVQGAGVSRGASTSLICRLRRHAGEGRGGGSSPKAGRWRPRKNTGFSPDMKAGEKLVSQLKAFRQEEFSDLKFC